MSESRVESRESRAERVQGSGSRVQKLVQRRYVNFVLTPCPRSLGPRSARAITLTEVLISLGILTIGLLGVAALFPVGSYYMQKGEIADRGSAIAQAAFNDLIARGMLNPAGG